MNKRGLELSFSMLFSVFIIAAILATVGYVILHFVSLGNCSQKALFIDDLQKKIDGAWNADESREIFRSTLPNGVDEVCFGSLAAGRARPQYEELSRFRDEVANMFFYPNSGSCTARYVNLDKVSIKGFFCIPVTSGSIEILLEKSPQDSLVFLCSRNTTACSPTLSRA